MRHHGNTEKSSELLFVFFHAESSTRVLFKTLFMNPKQLFHGMHRSYGQWSVVSHYSCNSADDNTTISHSMFPDSIIAKSYACGEKTAYMISHGLAPYFRHHILDKLQKNEGYVLLFDDPTTNKVNMHYLDSHFMGHDTAKDCLSHFTELREKLNMSHPLQFWWMDQMLTTSFTSVLAEDRLWANWYWNMFLAVSTKRFEMHLTS